jgi:threonine dehydrogenase-like Zn-dependent dehydrogenase
VPEAQGDEHEHGRGQAKIPGNLTDEQCVLLADIASTGISAAETANVQIGQTVAVFAQGPIRNARPPAPT